LSIWLNGIQTQFRTIDGLTIRFAESEDRDDHALLLSPWPESLYAFEPTWARLAEHTHLVAIDLPGFGHSQRRDALLSPRAMGEFVIRVADAFGLENPHVIGPDVGTAASLFAAALHPGRLRSLIVGSGGAAFPLRLGGVLKDWVEAPDLEEYRSADPRQIVAGALTDIERYALLDFVREDYLSSYEGDRFVGSMRYARTYPTELPLLRDLLPEIKTPVQIIAGARDPAVPPVNAEFLAERLPNSKLDIIDAGHFTWEDAADEYAALATSWWKGGYATTGSAAAVRVDSQSISTTSALRETVRLSRGSLGEEPMESSSVDTAVVQHQDKRLIVSVPMPYDHAVERFEQLVPAADMARFAQLATWDAVLKQAEINAPHGFMIYWRMDVTATMAGSGSGWKCTEYLMGNHTIAERMFRHDPSAMLYAPLRVLIHADRDRASRFVVDQPSTLFQSFDNSSIATVGVELDRLLADLLILLGAAAPQELKAP
jgi:pimeloyl-ACP methyl ester carboxylesterase